MKIIKFLLLSQAMVTSNFSSNFLNTSTIISNQKIIIKTNNLYVLGDSLSDNGSLSNILSFSIHRINLQAPFYNNSFTNGAVAAQVLAQKLGTTLKPAWHNNSKKGNNYAVAGARASEIHANFKQSWFLNHYSLINQTKLLLAEHTLQANDKILIEIGGNDLLTAMNTTSINEQNEIINSAINNQIIVIKDLINHGARNFVVSNTPDLSNIPLFNKSQVKNQANKISTRFNCYWKKAINNFITTNKQVNIAPYDLQTKFNNLLTKGAQIGKDIIHSSVQWGVLTLLLNQQPTYLNNTNEKNINNNAFFDHIHPNQWIHYQIGLDFFNLFKNMN